MKSARPARVPEQHRGSRNNNFREHSGRADENAPPTLRNHPHRRDVAIQAGHTDEQHHADLAAIAPQPSTGDGMRQLMNTFHGQRDDGHRPERAGRELRRRGEKLRAKIGGSQHDDVQGRRQHNGDEQQKTSRPDEVAKR